MNITADQLRAWADKIDSVEEDLCPTKREDLFDHLDGVRKELAKVCEEIMERYRDAVIEESKPTNVALPFRVVSVPAGSKLACPSGIVPAFIPDVPGAYILSTVPGPARSAR